MLRTQDGSRVVYLHKVAVCRLNAHPVLVEGAPHYLERLRQARRGGRGDDDAVAGADADELVAGRPEVEGCFVDSPELRPFARSFPVPDKR